MNQESTVNPGYEKPEVIDTFEALEVVGDTSGAGVSLIATSTKSVTQF